MSEEKKFRYLSISDIYVLSSLHEGFGICLLEAMYCGLPIVSTNNGGQTDFLVEGENALMVPIEDSEAIADKILEMLKNKDLRGKMIENNIKDIRKYDIENVAMKYEKLFEQCVE